MLKRSPSHALAIGVALVTGGLAFGCSSRDESTAANVAYVSEEELALARAAKALISGDQAHCTACHTASRGDVRRWGVAMLEAGSACLGDQTKSAAQIVACLSEDPSDPAAPYSAAKLGLLAAGAERLKSIFDEADPTGARFAAFKAASMPAGSQKAMTADEFDKVKDWVFAGMPAFNEVFGGPPEPAVCQPSTSPELKAHITAMKTDGWGARLAEQTTPMFGCGSSADAASCLASHPLVTEPCAAADVDQKLRVLYDMPRTSYWVRSSADGRFVGFGQMDAAGIIDLAAPAGSSPIKVDARYDPAFFPNNDGVSFAGTNLAGNDNPIKVCKQSVLVSVAARTGATLTLNEKGCSEIVNTVYQSVGASLDGAVFWMSHGSHVNDDGGNQITSPLEGFEQESPTFLVPMVSDGVSYQPKPQVTLETPLEGDQMLSPSSRLLVTRTGSRPDTRGYKIRRLATTTAPGVDGSTIGASTDVIGTLCGGGGKAMVSYDERFVVTHQYTDPAETGDLPESSSNVILWDLLTGERIRITTMRAGEFALYPHFRADGWLYFLVRDMNPNGKETLVASDVAIKRVATTSTTTP